MSIFGHHTATGLWTIYIYSNVHDKKSNYWNLHVVYGAECKTHLTFTSEISLDLKVAPKTMRHQHKKQGRSLPVKLEVITVKVPQQYIQDTGNSNRYIFGKGTRCHNRFWWALSKQSTTKTEKMLHGQGIKVAQE